jgi:hypothetical protein
MIEQDINLYQQIQITEPYKGNSKFEFFKNLEVGDLILIESPFKYANGNRGHTYAQKVRLINMRTSEAFSDSLNQILNRLDKCKYRKYE